MSSVSKKTMLDQLFDNLLQNKMQNEDVVKFKLFINDNEYDTESVGYDIGDADNSNICKQINDPTQFKCIVALYVGRIPRFMRKKLFQSIIENVDPLQLSKRKKKSFLKIYTGLDGFTSYCHWLIPNVILIGRRPSVQKYAYSIMDQGINCFVSLLEDGHESYAELINGYKSLHPDKYKEKDIKLISFPIEDFNIADDQKTVKIINDIVQLATSADNNKIYIHCASGHGRTGIIANLLVQAIYGVEPIVALEFVNNIHKVRCHESHVIDHYNQEYALPELEMQTAQIKRLQKHMMSIYEQYKGGTITNFMREKLFESIIKNVDHLQLSKIQKKSFLQTYTGLDGFGTYCHWLIPKVILIGRRPNDQSYAYSMMDQGINCFVSLLEDGHKSYADLINGYKSLHPDKYKERDITLISFPIEDFNIADDKKTVKIISDIVALATSDDDNKLYIHCASGHGRTGIIANLLIQAIYGVKPIVALEFVNNIHKVRCHASQVIDHYNQKYALPELDTQTAQIKRLHKYMMSIHEEYKEYMINQ